MSIDIKTISTAELVKDLDDSNNDINACVVALQFGIHIYSGGSVQERLVKNQGFVAAITAELSRRDQEDMAEKEIVDRSGEPEIYEDEDYPPSNEKMEYYKRGGR